MRGRNWRGGMCVTALALGTPLAGCGGGGSDDAAPLPTVSIEVPTSAPTYETTATGVSLGGSISGASFVHVRNTLTGTSAEGFVTYNQGIGSWFADVTGLVPGGNLITVTADADGTGARTAEDRITLIRPLQPAELVINGPDRSSTDTYWTDVSSFNLSHKIALFADGTGRATTGSTLAEEAGPVVDIVWSKIAPDAIVISSCPKCSFQTISRISGSLDEGSFYGEVVTVGGAGVVALDVLVLSAGAL